MKELKPCPFCGSEAEITDHGGFFTVGCTNLGCAVTIDLLEPSEEAAAADWNRRAAPENKPLTLEELRQMDGAPVWVKNNAHPEYSEWKICNGAGESHYYFSNGAAYELNHYGKTWLAYARRQEPAP